MDAKVTDDTFRIILDTFPFENAKVSTITYAFQLSKRIPLDDVIDMFENDKDKWNSVWVGIGTNAVLRVPGSKKTKKKTFRSFKNSLSILFNKVCVKVFLNGKCQITGCASIHQNVQYINMLIAFCKECLDIGEVRVVHQDLHMFNIIFNIHKSIKLMDLHKRMLSMKIVSLYNRDIYSGIKIKVPKWGSKNKYSTMLGFSSCNFILAGMKTKEDVESFLDILYLLQEL
jgi:TATA-box binding protein (TBP) (component of TFIID and TFIIIB)